MSIAEIILGGVATGSIMLFIGKLWGAHGAVRSAECDRRHEIEKESWQKDIVYIRESIIRIENHLKMN